jgi:pimeloyl-ACP methyl ester carboxylesterase
MPSVSTQHASIHYDLSGPEDADVIVFAHGAGGNRASWWQQVPHFAARNRVLSFDHRSFGQSTCEPGGFSPTHFADDLIAVLDAEGVDRAALVCQSMGGWTGLPLALRHPDRVRCLVLCDTPGGLFSDEIARALAATGDRIRDAGIQANAALAPDYPEREPEMAHLYACISAWNTGVDPGALAALASEEARIDPNELAGYQTPTLVIAGEHDLLFPHATLRHVAELIPGASFQSFPGCGHSVYFEDAKAFNRCLDDFLAAHP